jgi:hypothetical protein
MPMKKLYDFDQSADKFEREPQGVCQALSARWIVSRALWEPGRDGAWVDKRWMGEKRDMEAHVARIYSATRAARAAAQLQERRDMEDARVQFEKDRRAAIVHQRRRVTSSAAIAAAAAAPAAADPMPAGFSPDDLDARLRRVYVPTMPRTLQALCNDIEEHGGLEGSIHTYEDVSPAHAAHRICALGAGYKLIEIRDSKLTSEGGAHAIAAELRAGEARLFDPNAGEYKSEPPGSAWEAFGALVQFLLGTGYGLDAIRYLSVIHFPLKARGV